MAAVARSAKTVKKLEKPRPLKISSQNRYSTIDGRISTVEDIMTLADTVSSQLTNGNCDQLLQMNVVNLCANLKQYGQQLEAVYKDQLDRCFVAFRNGCRDEKVDYMSRVHLLEVIELRARNWVSSDDLNNYYRTKLSLVEQEVLPVPDTAALSLSPTALGQSVIPPTTPQPSLLNPGEVIKASGKFAKPTKIPGKNYCKDEVVIRNSDSGKVMGIKGRRVHMIEELSETIISFQRVNPGAKERLVQITGPNEEKINYAKHLIEDTIRRNASPVRLEHCDKERVGDSSSSLNSSASDESNRLSSLGGGRSKLLHSFSTSDATLEYKYTVTVDDHTIKITGANLDLVLTAKLILDEFFYGEQERPQPSRECDEGSEIEAGGLHNEAADPSTGASGRVDGIDSGATSESEETYKAPASNSMKMDSANCGFGLAKGEPSVQINAVRQQFLEISSRETELSGRVVDSGVKNSSPPFTPTSNKHFSRESSSDYSSSNSQKEVSYLYSREQLLQFSLSKCVKKQPSDWERICREYPGIISNKNAEMFDPVAYSRKWQEVEVVTAVISSTEEDPVDVE